MPSKQTVIRIIGDLFYNVVKRFLPALFSLFMASHVLEKEYRSNSGKKGTNNVQIFILAVRYGNLLHITSQRTVEGSAEDEGLGQRSSLRCTLQILS